MRKQSPIARLYRYGISYRPKVILASIFSILNKLFDIAPEILIGVAIDVVVSQEDSFLAKLGVSDPMDQILILAVLTFIVWALESITEYCYEILWRNLAQSIQNDLRLDTYEHVQNLDMSYFENASTGSLVAILNDDVNQLERFLDRGANTIIQVFTTVIAIGAIFFMIAPTVAVFAFTPIPIILAGAFYFQRKASPLYSEVRNRVGLLSARLSNNISGVAVIKSFTAEAAELAKLREESEAYRTANQKAIRVSSAFIPIIRMAILTGFLFTLVLGGYQTLNGNLNIGLYGVLVFLTQRLLWPLTSLAETVDQYERSMASTRRILDLLETPIQIQSNAETISLASVKGAIELKDVSFAYGNGIEILSNISLNIQAGETVAFVGPTGSGKTTLSKLLLRFYEPKTGKISLDGKDIRKLSLASLRKAIGLVSQDVFLFQGTVKENLLYGRPEATEEEIIKASKMAEAHDFIMALPEGYNTMVGERGQKLSGGQRQRLSIARAILKNPPVILLDEATSAVDNETEAAIQRSLNILSKGRTSILIAHRLSTVVHAHRIFVIEKGRIIESGSHQELLKAQGLYASLWNVQTGGATKSEALDLQHS